MDRDAAAVGGCHRRCDVCLRVVVRHGGRIEVESQVERLALHGFVHERLALTFDATWRVLLAAQ